MAQNRNARGKKRKMNKAVIIVPIVIILIFAVLLMTDLIAAKENQTVKLNSGYEMPTLSHLLAKSLKKGKL